MQALIVGSSGFIGTNMAKKLKERGCSKVLGVDIKKPQIEGMFFGRDKVHKKEYFWSNLIKRKPN